MSPEDQPPLGRRLWALVRARVIDELTRRPPSSSVRLDSDARSTTARVSSDGLVGLVGVPREVFPALALKNYIVSLSIRSAGYIPLQAAVAIPNDQRTIAPPAPPLNATVITLDTASRLSVGETLLIGPTGPTMATVTINALGPGPDQVTVEPGLSHPYAIGDPVVPIVPDDFAAASAGDFALHREPIVISGRVVQVVSGATIPLAGATIQVVGIWRTPPPANMVVAPDPPNLVSLHPPLYSDRAVGAGGLSRRNLPAVPGDIRYLLDDVTEGTNLVRVSNRLNLASGDILLIDAQRPDVSEYIAISTIEGSSSATQPATVTLDYPLAYPHRKNALTPKINPQPPGTQKQVTQEALAGDTCVFLNTMSALTSGSQVRVFGGLNPDEYHKLSLFSAISDAEGYYRLPPMSRVAQLNIRAEKTALTPVEIEFRPDYDLFENRLDFIFR
jgi:hypothetical protein